MSADRVPPSGRNDERTTVSDFIEAPWTDEQVEGLKRWQAAERVYRELFEL